MATRAAGVPESAARGAIMLLGATRHAATPAVVTALCRALSRRGVRVAPFAGQNREAHAAVTPDGGEIGRAQAVQAVAAGVEPDRRMGPVLRLEATESRPRLVVMGEELAEDRHDGYEDPRALRAVVLDALRSLRAEHEVVVLEGAPRDTAPLYGDAGDLPLAAAAGVPAVLVVDVDRGGSLASAQETWDLVPAHLREQVRGLLLSCHLDDLTALDRGRRDLESRTGVPVLGVLPHPGGPFDGHLAAGVEGSTPRGRLRPDGPATDAVRVAAVRLPHLDDPADLGPLLLEPSVDLRWVTRPAELEEADLVLLPSSRTTIADLAWLREQGLDTALSTLDRKVRLFGLGSGYQMLGGVIRDELVSPGRAVHGLGLLPVETTLASPKVVRRSRGRVVGTEIPVAGFQIRWGRVRRLGGHALFDLEDHDAEAGTRLEGCVSDRHVRGTSLHGVLECDRLRHALLWKAAAGRERTFVPSRVPFHQAFDAHLDSLADWVDQHLDVGAVLVLARQAVAPGREPGW